MTIRRPREQFRSGLSLFILLSVSVFLPFSLYGQRSWEVSPATSSPANQYYTKACEQYTIDNTEDKSLGEAKRGSHNRSLPFPIASKIIRYIENLYQSLIKRRFDCIFIFMEPNRFLLSFLSSLHVHS